MAVGTDTVPAPIFTGLYPFQHGVVIGLLVRTGLIRRRPLTSQHIAFYNPGPWDMEK